MRHMEVKGGVLRRNSRAGNVTYEGGRQLQSHFAHRREPPDAYVSGNVCTCQRGRGGVQAMRVTSTGPTDLPHAMLRKRCGVINAVFEGCG